MASNPALALAETQLRVPPGFTVHKAAGDPDVLFPMFATFDDRGRLFVAESSGLDLYSELTAQTRNCRVRLLEDRDGDGRYETTKVFADKLVFPMGIAWRAGKLYVADPPDLVAFDDANGDGEADNRRVILTGFGHKDNGSLHGLVFGPDGLLYMTMGSPDGYRLQRADGTLLTGTSGALIRCRADGTDPEVLCRGFENLVEVAFTSTGAIVGTDNWFQLPAGGVRDALVHLVDGGRYPLDRDNRGATGEWLPPISLYPAVALSGVVAYRGISFPPEMRGNFFTAQHNSRKIGRHVLIEEGSTFRTEDHEFVTSDDPDFHPSDVLEDAEGSLLIVDTGGWYVQHCPTGKIRNSRALGGIFRVRGQAAQPMADPWGLHIQWASLSATNLAELLGDRRPAVRDRACQLLASHSGAITAINSLFRGRSTLTAKEHALWALSATTDSGPLQILHRQLTSGEPSLVIIAAQALAFRADASAAAALANLLSASSPHVRLAAAQALRHCGNASVVPQIWNALKEADVFLQHGLIQAASRFADAQALQSALANPSPRVQRAALLLFEQSSSLHANDVMERISTPDPELRRTAFQLLQKHVEWADQAAAFLDSELVKPELSEPQRTSLRELIIAFQSQPAIQKFVGQYLSAADTRVSQERRKFLFDCLAQTTLRQLPTNWVAPVASALDEAAWEIRAAAVRLANRWPAPVFDRSLASLAEDVRAPSAIRLDALRGLISRQPALSKSSVAFLIDQLSDRANPVSRLGAAEILGRSRLGDDVIAQVVRALQGDNLIAPSTLLPLLLRASEAGMHQVAEYLTAAVRNGWRPSEHELTQILPSMPKALQRDGELLAKLLREAREGEASRLAKLEPLLRDGDEARGRAIFFGEKAACSTCHRIANQGGMVGPDLTKVGAIRAGRDLIESIIFPSSTFAQGYERYAAALKDGRELDGIIARQDNESLLLRDSTGAETLVHRADLKELQRKSVSLMPEGLESAFSPQEFSDLLAFLQTLK